MLVGLNISQCKALLKLEMRKQAVFLAIDNMSDNMESIQVAKFLLRAGFDKRSAVIVTARSLNVLKMKHLDIDDSNCLEMPELEKEEAKSLFLQHATCDMLPEEQNEVDDKIISLCVKQCYFQKFGDGKSYHYHPLALKVLGGQLGCDTYDPVKWASQLEEFDTFNPLRNMEHPIFSIFRKSFDTLLLSDQLLFLDVALCVPERVVYGHSVFDWLSMVHGISVSLVMKVLEVLKRKSLLEDLGDGFRSKIGMHDLWREFAELETEVGGFGCRSWVYEVGRPSSFEEVTPSRGWQNVKRMCFVGNGVMCVKKINFDHFPNTIVMKLVCNGVYLGVRMLNVMKLKHLKSLELEVGYNDKIEVHGLRLMENIRFLKLSGVRVSNIDDIEHLTTLQVLVVYGFRGRRLLDLSKLVSLQKVHFYKCSQVATITGFSSRLSNRRRLQVEECDELQSFGGGADDLVLTALEELILFDCPSLKAVPDLSSFQILKEVFIQHCSSLRELTCTGPLTALQKLYLADSSSLKRLPSLSNFPGLKKFSLTSYAGLLELFCGGPLDALEKLYVEYCRSLKRLPSLSNFQGLKTLRLWGCDSLVELTCNGPLVAIQELKLHGCRSLKSVPDLIDFPGLKKFSLKSCDGLLELFCGGPLDALEQLYVEDCSSVNRLPNLSNFQGLKTLELWRCDSLVELTYNGPLVALQELKLDGCGSLKSVPDLIDFVGLKRVSLGSRDGLLELFCGGPLDAREQLYVWDCSSLKILSSLSNFQGLKTLRLWRCDSLVVLTYNGPLVALQELKLDGCRSLKSVPDLVDFLGLKRIFLGNFDGLLELFCGGPLDAREQLYVRDCSSLNRLPSLSNFQGSKTLELWRCDSLSGVDVQWATGRVARTQA